MGRSGGEGKELERETRRSNERQISIERVKLKMNYWGWTECFVFDDDFGDLLFYLPIEWTEKVNIKWEGGGWIRPILIRGGEMAQ